MEGVAAGLVGRQARTAGMTARENLSSYLMRIGSEYSEVSLHTEQAGAPTQPWQLHCWADLTGWVCAGYLC